MNKQEARGAAAREKICQAAIRCLAELGYAETSILRVVERAGVSKGALQHHFPTKEDLMTAAAERILANATFLPDSTPRKSQPRDVKAELMHTWTKLVDTDEYRALLEILVAIRTDAALHERLSPILKEWERSRMVRSAELYTSPGGDDETVRQLITLSTCLMRGLVIQEQYNEEPGRNLDLMRTWIGLLAPLLEPRGEAGGENGPGSIPSAQVTDSVAK